MDLLEGFDSVGEQPKKAVVMVGRMNPPTRGHYKVIDAMKSFIRQNPKLNLDAKPIVVVIEGAKSSKNKDKNPLTAEQRIAYMQASGHANGVTFLTAPSAVDAFEEVRRAGFETAVIAAGSDRAKNYMKMLEKYFTAKDGSTIKRQVVPGLDRDMDDEQDDGPEAMDRLLDAAEEGDSIPLSLVSGTLARRAAFQDKKKAFSYIVGLDKKPRLAVQMMTAIKKSMEAGDEST
jgi:hypothetical protein